MLPSTFLAPSSAALQILARTPCRSHSTPPNRAHTRAPPFRALPPSHAAASVGPPCCASLICAQDNMSVRSLCGVHLSQLAGAPAAARRTGLSRVAAGPAGDPCRGAAYTRREAAGRRLASADGKAPAGARGRPLSARLRAQSDTTLARSPAQPVLPPRVLVPPSSNNCNPPRLAPPRRLADRPTPPLCGAAGLEPRQLPRPAPDAGRWTRCLSPSLTRCRPTRPPT